MHHPHLYLISHTHLSKCRGHKLQHTCSTLARPQLLTFMWSRVAGVPVMPAMNASRLNSVTEGTDTWSGSMSLTAASAVDTKALMCSATCQTANSPSNPTMPASQSCARESVLGATQNGRQARVNVAGHAAV